MRKTTQITIILLALLGVGGWLALAKPWESASDIGTLRTLATAFTEDLQYKDFRRSSLYHHGLERDRVDIGRAIERLFVLKPELLDIQRFDITRAEIDSTGKRGKTLVRVRFKRLNQSDKKEEKDVALYWIKRDPGCPLGGTCSAAGQCQDEQGKPMHQLKDDQKSRSGTSRKNAPEERGEQPFTCTPGQPEAWFMNLDSTLEAKPYQ